MKYICTNCEIKIDESDIIEYKNPDTILDEIESYGCPQCESSEDVINLDDYTDFIEEDRGLYARK